MNRKIVFAGKAFAIFEDLKTESEKYKGITVEQYARLQEIKNAQAKQIQKGVTL